MRTRVTNPSLTRRVTMFRPTNITYATLTLRTSLRSRILPTSLENFQYLFKFVLDRHGPIGKRNFVDTGVGQLFVDRAGFGRVVRDCCVRVFKLVSGQDTDDSIAGGDDAFFSQ